MQEENGQHGGDGNQRQVDPPDPPPVDVLAEQRAEDGPQDTPHRHGDGQEADVQRALFQGRDIGDDDLAQHVEAAAAEPLQHAAEDDDGHGLGDGEDNGADGEEDERGVERELAPYDVRDTGVDRLDDHDGEHEGDAGPEGFERRAVELAGDCLWRVRGLSWSTRLALGQKAT
ncbi:hypothetical protein VTN77DRAFT_3856 [Rasamsonia byssochlamydoides]|uniref:uncharacterized protein n=1 Tax=Rasamsonia byssochlamydoides TaxID=89139 RepID=UPI00374440D3